MRFYFLFFLNQKSRVQSRISFPLRPSFNLLSYGRISLLLGLRKSSLDSIFRNHIRFFVQRKIAGFKRTLRFGRFFSRVFDPVFLFPGGIGFGDVLFAPVYALIAGHPWWMFFLNASYIPAVLLTIILRERGKSLRKAPIPMGLYFGIGLMLTFLSRVFFESDLAPFTLFSEYSEE